MSSGAYKMRQDDKQREDNDIANAIRASLEIGRNHLPPVQDRWIPQSESDWKTYRRQQQLIENSRAEAEARAMDDLEPPKAEPIPIRPKQVPQTASDWKTYGDPQQSARFARADPWSLERNGTTSITPKEPENRRLEPFNDDPRAPKTESDWSLHLRQYRQQLANEPISNAASDGKQDWWLTLNSPVAKDSPSTTVSSSRWRDNVGEKINEENTLMMQAGQKASNPVDGEKQAEPSDLLCHPPANVPSGSVPPSRQTIEDRIKEMQADSPVELEWKDESDGDTFIYIDPPAKQPEQTERMYRNYVERYKRPLVIRSTRLQALHSPFFDKLLGPTAQYRTVRRRGLTGRLPHGIKYVIDLTPPSEGEDAAWLMTELCCVQGVQNWYQASERWACSTTLVGGQDEFTALPAGGATPEFSPIRHRSSIERVLNAIRDIDPNLDSAVKVYTTFTVARFFEITQSPLTDYIVRWLRAPPNSLFIEALPEIALKIGDGLRCHDLIRDSFAILVSEEALANLEEKPDSSHTTYGRKKNDVPEAYRTRIEYASRSFMDRVSQTFENLVEPEMTWMETLPEFRQLSNDKNESRELLVQETKAAIKAFVRGVIYKILWSELQDAPKFDLGISNWGTAGSLYPWTSQIEFWNSLNRSGRLMTTTFWSVLGQFQFFTCSSFANGTSLTCWPEQNSAWRAKLSHDQKELLVRMHYVEEVRCDYLDDLVTRCRRGRTSSQWSSTGMLKPLQYQKRFPRPDPWPARVREASDAQAPENPVYKDSGNSGGANKDPGLLYDACGIDLDERILLGQIEDYILSICHQMLGPPDLFNREEPMRPVMTPSLVCLDEAEWKYLPLYAGGYDDESGGVFNDDVPMAEAGFSTAGPGVHTGTGSSAASSDYDFVGGKEVESTHHTSTMTNDSFSDQLDHRKVYSDDSELWEHIRDKKNFPGSTTGSNVDTSTLAAPSTIDGESDDGFVLPLRPRETGAETIGAVLHGPGSELPEGIEDEAPTPEDYSDLFLGTDQDMGDYDEDDDTATEKGENDSDAEAHEEPAGAGDSEDEDMVLV
ncbi:MAG: hypothetical protein L6R36_009193 [Xanthoria steineri]|nr:MAG: hypothetical protein L6R36_009193 [Xanthoria steineri]